MAKKTSGINSLRSDTASVVTYDVNALWNEYMENPASLDHNKREFLGSKLDTLKIEEIDKQTFCNFRTEYDRGPEEKNIMTPQETMKDFKILFNWAIYDKLDDEHLENIITAIEMSSLEEDDYRDCIALVKLRILKSKDTNEDSSLLEQLKNRLEADLVEKLIVKLRDDDGMFELPFKDILFLDNHWNEHNNKHANLNKFHLKIWENARSSANYVHITSKVANLFDKAEEILQKFIKLGNEKPEIFPESFDHARTGGFITVSVGDQDTTIPRELVQTRQIGWGDILTQQDPEYGTRGDKYNFFSRMKDLFAILEGKKDSGDTSFNKTGVKGRIAFDLANKVTGYMYPHKKIGFSYSGLTQLQDQAIVVIAAREAWMITDAELIEWKESSNNPYLTAEFLKDLAAIA